MSAETDAYGWTVEDWRATWENTDRLLRRALDREREFARQAREGERLRVAVRHLIDNASAGLIHYSGESVDVVRASDLRHAMGDPMPESEYWDCTCGMPTGHEGECR